MSIISANEIEIKEDLLCNICEYNTKKIYSLRRHERIQHQINSKSCCLQYKRTKKEHQAIHEGKLYKCHICNFKAMTSLCVFTHKQSEHTGKEYDCDKCEYKGLDQNNLTNHQKVKHVGL